MKVDVTPRAARDLARIGRRSRRVFGNAVAATLETYIRATLARIGAMPKSGEPLHERPQVRVVPLVRYPFKIYYTVARETVFVLHIRHTSRRAWSGRDE